MSGAHRPHTVVPSLARGLGKRPAEDLAGDSALHPCQRTAILRVTSSQRRCSDGTDLEGRCHYGIHGRHRRRVRGVPGRHRRLWLISSARGTALAVFVLGMVGGCMLSAAGDLYRGPQSRAVRAWRVIASVLGVVAFAAAVAGLASGSTVALAVLVAATGALWLIATGRHALMAPTARRAPGTATK